MSTNAASIQRTDVNSAVASQLIAALNAELQRYPEEGANFFGLDPSEVVPGQGSFLVATVDGRAVGCGAFRRLDTKVAEIKRMYVEPEYRGRGIARAVLARLEAEARALGISRLVLETGDRQPEALALFRSVGFVDIPCFGEYADAPLSLCLGKDLDQSSGRPSPEAYSPLRNPGPSSWLPICM